MVLDYSVTWTMLFPTQLLCFWDIFISAERSSSATHVHIPVLQSGEENIVKFSGILEHTTSSTKS